MKMTLRPMARRLGAHRGPVPERRLAAAAAGRAQHEPHAGDGAIMLCYLIMSSQVIMPCHLIASQVIMPSYLISSHHAISSHLKSSHLKSCSTPSAHRRSTPTRTSNVATTGALLRGRASAKCRAVSSAGRPTASARIVTRTAISRSGARSACAYTSNLDGWFNPLAVFLTDCL